MTLPEVLYELVERSRAVEHRTRSEVIQEALRTHSCEAIYVPTRRRSAGLLEALDGAEQHPDSLRDWSRGEAGAAHRALRVWSTTASVADIEEAIALLAAGSRRGAFRPDAAGALPQTLARR